MIFTSASTPEQRDKIVSNWELSVIDSFFIDCGNPSFPIRDRLYAFEIKVSCDTKGIVLARGIEIYFRGINIVKPDGSGCDERSRQDDTDREREASRGLSFFGEAGLCVIHN